MKPTWAPPIQFAKITRIYKPWPKNWLRDSKPGYLFLDDPLHEKDRGGILRLTREGLFVSVTREQAYRGALIPWPGANTRYKGIRISGSEYEVELKKDARG